MKKAKLIIVCLVAVCMAQYAQAQSLRLSLGVEVAQPTGDFSDYAKTGYGGSLRVEFPMLSRLGLGLTAGYISFGGDNGGPTINMIPVQAFGKFYLGENQGGLYGQVDLGVHSISVKDADGETDFSWALGLGYHMSKLDFGVRWQTIEEDKSASYVGLRIAYVFGSR